MNLVSSARMIAERTPPSRNRAVDFFRVAAIVMVVVGHWLANIPYLVGDELHFAKLLVLQPWTQFLTWLAQVMPVFFFVGGYSNAASWASACREPGKRNAWQASRLKRLLLPTLPLIVLWTLAAGIAGNAGLESNLIRDASRAALIPVWFLAVYIMVTVLVPVSFRAWRRWGLYSVTGLVVCAAIVDLIAFGAGVGWIRWVNYGFVWLAVHQLGYWWHRGIEGVVGPAILLTFGIASLALLLAPFGYPIAMISVPGAEISNSRPPTFAMLSIGFCQAGLIFLFVDRVSIWLQRPGPWSMVVIIGRRIMTIYLWHLSALLALIALLLRFNGFGLRSVPGTTEWWSMRPIWITLLFLLLIPFLVIFGRLEEGSRKNPQSLPGPFRSVIGACISCAGLACLALQGTFAENALGMNWLPVGLTIAGIFIATIKLDR